MIKLGIIVSTMKMVDSVKEQIYNYLHVHPARSMQGCAIFYLPLLTIEILYASDAIHGRRFNLVYCDEEVLKNEKFIYSCIRPCCMGTSIRDLEHFLLQIKT